MLLINSTKEETIIHLLDEIDELMSFDWTQNEVIKYINRYSIVNQKLKNIAYKRAFNY